MRLCRTGALSGSASVNWQLCRVGAPKFWVGRSPISSGRPVWELCCFYWPRASRGFACFDRAGQSIDVCCGSRMCRLEIADAFFGKYKNKFLEQTKITTCHVGCVSCRRVCAAQWAIMHLWDPRTSAHAVLAFSSLNRVDMIECF